MPRVASRDNHRDTESGQIVHEATEHHERRRRWARTVKQVAGTHHEVNGSIRATKRDHLI